MVKIETCAALLIITLVSGCATNGGQHDSASASAPAGVVGAPRSAPPPLNAPPASTKRLVLNMTGPAVVTQAKDWPAFQEEWRATFADHAKEAGVAFEVQKGDPRSPGEGFSQK